MKYPKMTWGRIEALINKLGGEEAIERILRGEEIKSVIPCTIPCSIRVGRWLIERGCHIYPLPKEGTCYWIYDRKATLQNRLSSILSRLLGPRRKEIARIDLTDKPEDRRWSISVHGKDYQGMIEEIAGEMTAAFNAKIEVTMVSDAVKYEDNSGVCY